MIDTITKAINKNYYLDREDKEWLVAGATKTIRLKAPNKNAIGFSLDKTTKPKEIPPLAIFEGSSSRNLAKMCDAMIALTDQNKLYLFAIELKSRHKGYYKKQLANGEYFWQWLMALCKEHNYPTNKTIKPIKPIYVRILIWFPREKSAPKGMTAHRDNVNITKNEHGILKVQNQTTVYLAEILKQYEKAC